MTDLEEQFLVIANEFANKNPDFKGTNLFRVIQAQAARKSSPVGPSGPGSPGGSQQVPAQGGKKKPIHGKKPITVSGITA